MASLKPYISESWLSALVAKLNAIANPEDLAGDAGAEEQIVKSMQDCERIMKSDPDAVAESLRESAGDARRDLERAYLNKMSATGSHTWEAAARAAGHVS